MRSTIPLLRGSKGYNWYYKYGEKGVDAFVKKHISPTAFDWEANGVNRPKAYFDIVIDKFPAGRIIFELAHDIVPKTVSNFINLCRGNDKFWYKGTKIHDLRKGLTITGGDVEMKNGYGGHSSFPERFFADENFIIPHTSRGMISMVSVGVWTNNSQFTISLSPAKHLNGRSVVFGRIIQGDDVLKKIEDVFTVRGMPVRDVLVADCGVLDEGATDLRQDSIAA